ARLRREAAAESRRGWTPGRPPTRPAQERRPATPRAELRAADCRPRRARLRAPTFPRRRAPAAPAARGRAARAGRPPPRRPPRHVRGEATPPPPPRGRRGGTTTGMSAFRSAPGTGPRAPPATRTESRERRFDSRRSRVLP